MLPLWYLFAVFSDSRPGENDKPNADLQISAGKVTIKCQILSKGQAAIGDGKINDTSLSENSNGNFVIPSSTIHQSISYQIIKVNKYAFYKANLTDVILPASINTLDDYSFAECSNVASIDLSKTKLTHLSEKTFYNSNIQTVILPKTLESIDSYSFEGCYLNDIEIPSGVTSIGKAAFKNCVKIANVDLSKTHLKVIEESTFEKCYCLNKVDFPSGLTKIGKFALRQTQIRSLLLPSTVSDLDEGAFVGTFIDRIDLTKINISVIKPAVFLNCSRLIRVIFPKKLTKIGHHAFAGTQIEAINIPNTVKEIGEYAFARCSRLLEADFSHLKMKAIPDGLFAGSSDFEEFTFPIGVTAIGRESFKGVNFVNITLGKNIISIGEGAYSESFLKEINLTDTGLTSMPKNIFANCTSLSKIHFSEQITAFEDGCFSGTNLTEVTIPERIKNVGRGVFAFCTRLESASFNMSNLEEIPPMTFMNCVALSDISFPPKISAIREYALAGTNLTEIELPETIEIVERRAFYMCRNLESADLSQAPLKTLPVGLFTNCTKLRQVLVPPTLEAIDPTIINETEIRETIIVFIPQGGKEKHVDTTEAITFSRLSFLGDDCDHGSFFFANRLQSLDLSGTKITEIPEYAFANYGGVNNITLPAGTEIIGKAAFKGSNLTEIEIPGTVREIGEAAFAEAPQIRKIDLTKTSVKHISKHTFYLCPRLKTIKLPQTLESIGDSAFDSSGLTKIRLPHGVKSLRKAVFTKANSLETVDLSNTEITDLPDFAFSCCRSLNDIALPRNLTRIGMCALGKTNISIMRLPATVIDISQNAFQVCENLHLIDMSRTGVRTLQSCTFVDCFTLKSILLPNFLSTISDDAFAGCNEISSVYYLGTSPDMLSNAFPLTANVYVTNDYPDRVFCGIEVQIIEGDAAVVSMLDQNEKPSKTALEFHSFLISQKPLDHPKIIEYDIDGTNVNFRITNKTEVAIGTSDQYENAIEAERPVELHIPETITTEEGTFTVTSIDSFAFLRSNIKKIIFPSSIHSIGDVTFAMCYHLKFVDLSACRLTKIPKYTFYRSTPQTVLLPQTIETIEGLAFANCTCLGEFNWPSALRSIGDEAFAYCRNLTSFDLSRSYITEFRPMTFYWCSSLKSIKLPQKLVKIGAQCFVHCSFHDVSFPRGLLEIGKMAFKDCVSILQVDLASTSVTVLETGVFENCYRISDVSFPLAIQRIGSHAFAGTSIAELDMPSVDEAGSAAFGWCTDLKTVQLTSSRMTRIPKQLFEGCTALESVVFPARIEDIADEAFYMCVALTSIDLSQTSVRAVGRGAFARCVSLAKVQLPPALASIGQLAFAFSGLQKVELSATITSLGDEAFFHCRHLASISLEHSGLNEIPTRAFALCSVLSNVSLPRQLSSVGEAAFISARISSLVFPESLVSIGEKAFACTGLLGIDMSTTKVTQIGDFAFANCSSLVTATLSVEQQTVGQGVFKGCSALRNVHYGGHGPIDGDAGLSESCGATVTSSYNGKLFLGKKPTVDDRRKMGRVF